MSFLDTREGKRSASPRLDSLSPPPLPRHRGLFRRSPQQILVFLCSGDLLTHGALALCCLRGALSHPLEMRRFSTLCLYSSLKLVQRVSGVRSEGGVAGSSDTLVLSCKTVRRHVLLQQYSGYKDGLLSKMWLDDMEKLGVLSVTILCVCVCCLYQGRG